MLVANVDSASAQMSIPGKFQVNAAGAATYTVPIAVPPGIAGLTPPLTLEYNSQGPNGIIGMGWSLGGLPAITRCAATIAQDGARGTITYTATDRFCLEGQRLVAISGGYGADGTEYRTEIDSFTRIISHGSWRGGPAWFEVHTKSGHIMQFGNSPDSQVLSCIGPIRAWAVNLVADTTYHFYTVSYQNDSNCGGSGEAYPQTIGYAGNTVTFLYASGRPDNILLYEAGSKQEVTTLLTNVRTSAQGSGVADYRLAYQQTPSTHRSYLTSVTLCDQAQSPSCLPPTTFGWNSANDGFALGPGQWTFTGGVAPAAMAQGDVNGDGCGDLIVYWNDQFNFYVKVLVSNCQGGFTVSPTWQTPNTNAVNAGSNVSLADVDGDGRADLVITLADQTGPHAAVALSNGQTFGAAQVWNGGVPLNWNDGVFYDSEQATYTIYWNLAVADIDGDGRADLVAYLVGQSGLETNVAFAGHDGQFPFDVMISGLVPGNFGGASATLADIDGDGRTDLVASIVNVTGWQLFAATSQGNGSFLMANPGGSFLPFNAIGWGTAAGDLNGDGRMDFVIYRGNGSLFQAQLAFSRGDGTFVFQPANPAPGGLGQPGGLACGQTYNGYSLTIADVNGDGRADLVPYYFDLNNAIFFTLISNGDGTFTCGQGQNFSQKKGWQIFTADLNGDGRSDIVLAAFLPDRTLDFITFLTAGQPLLATSFTTGLGATTNVGYAPLTSGVYTKGNGHVWPQPDTQGPLYVVGRIDAPTGIANPTSYTTYYSYLGARLDLTGRGFLGFAQMNTFDPQTNLSTATTFRQDFPFIGMVMTEQKSLGGQVLNQAQNNYQFVNAAGGSSVSNQSVTSAPYRVALLSSQAYSYDLDGTVMPSITTTYGPYSSNYDAYNNPLSISVSTSDGYTTVTNNTYYNDTTNWYLGRLTQTQVTRTGPAAPTAPGQPTPPDLTVASSHGAFLQGQAGATYTITVTNSGGGPADGSMVTVEDTVPAGLTATAMWGAGWTCEVGIGSPNCTRSDVLAAGASFPTITLTVNVATNAPASVTNVVTVAGGGETNTGNDTYNDQTIISAAPDMTVALTDCGCLSLGGTGTYTITATNVGQTATSGTVTVVDTLPSTLTAAAMSGSGWSCTLSTLTCTRTDALAAAASYPAITLAVSVAFNAPDPVTNVATVSGGGEVNTSNDTASDPTTLYPAGSGNKAFLTAGTSWTVPSNWNSGHNKIEVIGGGGGGSAPVGLNTAAGAGGGGGGYSQISNLALTPGSSIAYQIGTGGAASTAGGDTWFNGTSLASAAVGAKGGGGASGPTAGAGGNAASGVGSVKFAGGSGANSGLGNNGGWGGTGGGGAAGPNGMGGNGATNPAGTLGGGGGGGNGGGAAGALPSGGYGGAGGSPTGGCCGGPAGDPTNYDDLDGSAGLQGGGGGGGAGIANMDDGWGGNGSGGTEWSASYGSGGGAGGGGGGGGSLYAGGGGNGGLYGGGGSGGGSTYGAGNTIGNGGSGAQGLIVITYWP